MDLKFDNDLVIEKGDLVLVSGAKETGQRVRDRLLTFRNEWFLDLDYGPNYLRDVMIKNPRLNIVAAILKQEILKSAPNAEFTTFDASINSSRELSINYELSTIDGPLSDEIAL